MIIETREQALAAVEAAAWDADNSALSGATIWGTQGRWAYIHAASNFSYKQAVRVAEQFAHDEGV